VRVLVVDDSPAIRVRLVTLLREIDGLDLFEASGADEALSSLASVDMDVVLLDLHMPGRTGLDALPAIKARVPSPLVIVLTGHPTDHHERLCLAMGADYFFDKSKDFARVLELLDPPSAGKR
jgi:two-component system, NarL family, response regulator DevR